MAIFKVTAATDNGLGDTEGSLSWAIEQANNSDGADTIELDTDVRLALAEDLERMEPRIETNITIEGNSHSISGDNDNDGIVDLYGQDKALFYVEDGNVKLKNLTLTNGVAKGNNGDGASAGMGGALFIWDGNVIVSNVEFLNNRAIGGSLRFRSYDYDYIHLDGYFGSGGLRGSDGGYGLRGSDGGYGGDGGNGGWGGGGIDGKDGGFGAAGGGGGDGGYGGWGGRGIDGGDGGRGGDGGDGGYAGRGGFGAGNNGLDAGGRNGRNGSDGSDGSDGGWGGDGGRGGDGGYGGGGAGFGGAVFIRSGNLTLNNATFYNNQVEGGKGLANKSTEDNGKGLGGAIFALHTLNNPNGNNRGMPTSLPTVTVNNVVYRDNLAPDSSGTATDNDNYFGVEVEYFQPEIRTNGGRDGYTDLMGDKWSDGDGFSNGRSFTRPNEIAHTDDDFLYQSEYFGKDFSYQQTVKNDTYDVTLKFAEIYFNQPGKRVFDVKAEDKLILDDFDIVAATGSRNVAIDRTFTVPVYDGSLDLDFIGEIDNAKISAIEIKPSDFTTRANGGRDSYTDISGQEWSGGEGFSNGRSFGGQNEIAETEDDFLYQSEYFGKDFSYQQKVENGSYDVTLKFAEVYFQEAGKRVFDVTLEDRLILDDFDIFAEAGGKDIALDHTFTVHVGDGSLDLDFLGEIDNAKISAIAIEPSNF